jgi:hypothetical protein
VMAVSLITQGRRGTHAKPLCSDASVFSLECTSTAQPYRKALTQSGVHGPQLAMQMLSCIDKWRTRAPPLCASSSRTCTTNAMRVEQARFSIVSAWPWQELAQPGSTGHLQDAAGSVSCALLCLVKESGTSMLISYCHRRLFIHAQSGYC